TGCSRSTTSRSRGRRWPGAAPDRGCRREGVALVEPIGLTAGEVAAATGGRLRHGAAHVVIDGVSIDSRTAAPGDLFVAIRGDRFDGHQFAADALDRGAIGAVVERGSLDRLPLPARGGGADAA